MKSYSILVLGFMCIITSGTCFKNAAGGKSEVQLSNNPSMPKYYSWRTCDKFCKKIGPNADCFKCCGEKEAYYNHSFKFSGTCTKSWHFIGFKCQCMAEREELYRNAVSNSFNNLSQRPSFQRKVEEFDRMESAKFDANFKARQELLLAKERRRKRVIQRIFGINYQQQQKPNNRKKNFNNQRSLSINSKAPRRWF